MMVVVFFLVVVVVVTPLVLLCCFVLLLPVPTHFGTPQSSHQVSSHRSLRGQVVVVLGGCGLHPKVRNRSSALFALVEGSAAPHNSHLTQAPQGGWGLKEEEEVRLEEGNFVSMTPPGECHSYLCWVHPKKYSEWGHLLESLKTFVLHQEYGQHPPPHCGDAGWCGRTSPQRQMRSRA